MNDQHQFLLEICHKLKEITLSLEERMQQQQESSDDTATTTVASQNEDRFKEQLAHAKEEAAKLSKLLEDADQRAEVSKRKKEEILAKSSQAKKMLEECKSREHQLEEDNAKLQHSLEDRSTILKQTIMDCDNHVDRCLVIKILVTYFERNHNNEVLNLMVHILQFSDEEKQRIGASIRGVLGLLGRLVAGILGGGSAATAASEKQSLAALWVNFLLKETERERRDLEDAAGRAKKDSH